MSFSLKQITNKPFFKDFCNIVTGCTFNIGVCTLELNQNDLILGRCAIICFKIDNQMFYNYPLCSANCPNNICQKPY